MSNIEWTEKTWNPIVGCSKISEGCRNCYAINQSHRNAAMGAKLDNPGRLAYYEGLTEKRGDRTEWTGKVAFVPEALGIPLKTRKPTTWFVNSMSDLFHESVTDGQLDQIFAVMAASPRHTYQVLTKRPERMLAYFTERHLNRLGTVSGVEIAIALPLPNVWLGVTVENQKAADERIPLLLQTPAAVRFLSCEPLLEDIDLSPYFVNVRFQQNQLTGECRLITSVEGIELTESDLLANYAQTATQYRKPIDWVIVGGESGPGARPCNPFWIQSVVDQCKSAKVPVFVKQLGGFPDKRHDFEKFPASLQLRQICPKPKNPSHSLT